MKLSSQDFCIQTLAPQIRLSLKVETLWMYLTFNDVKRSEDLIGRAGDTKGHFLCACTSRSQEVKVNRKKCQQERPSKKMNSAIIFPLYFKPQKTTRK